MHLARACSLVLPKLLTLHPPSSDGLLPQHAAPLLEAAIVAVRDNHLAVLLSRYLARSMYGTFLEGEAPSAVLVTSIFMLRILCNALLHGMRHMDLSQLAQPTTTDAETRLRAWMRRRVLQLLTLLRRGGLWTAIMTCAGGGNVVDCSQAHPRWHQGTPRRPCTSKPARFLTRGRCRCRARQCKITSIPCAASSLRWGCWRCIMGWCHGCRRMHRGHWGIPKDAWRRRSRCCDFVASTTFRHTPSCIAGGGGHCHAQELLAADCRGGRRDARTLDVDEHTVRVRCSCDAAAVTRTWPPGAAHAGGRGRRPGLRLVVGRCISAARCA